MIILKFIFITCKAHKPCQWKASSPLRVVCVFIYRMHSLMLVQKLSICILWCSLSVRFSNVYWRLLTYTDVLLTSLHILMNLFMSFKECLVYMNYLWCLIYNHIFSNTDLLRISCYKNWVKIKPNDVKVSMLFLAHLSLICNRWESSCILRIFQNGANISFHITGTIAAKLQEWSLGGSITVLLQYLVAMVTNRKRIFRKHSAWNLNILCIFLSYRLISSLFKSWSTLPSLFKAWL